MPEVPNDGVHLTSDTATLTDAKVSSSVVAMQPIGIQTDSIEAELIGVLTGPVAGG